MVILGLHSLYFLLAGIITKSGYLKLGLSFVLIFVGAKMLPRRYPGFFDGRAVRGYMRSARAP